jgi:hypothetical protein
MDIIKQLIGSSNNDGHEYRDLLAWFIDTSLVHPGSFPTWVTDFLGSAEIIGINQRVDKCRPVQMGCEYAKIADKFVSGQKFFLDIKKKTFGTTQCGVGAAFGCEKFVGKIRTQMQANPYLDASRSDYKDAFCRVNRSKIIQAVHLAHLALVFKTTSEKAGIQRAAYYGVDGGVTLFPVVHGIPQGKSSSSDDYALATQPFLDEIDSICRPAGADELHDGVRCGATGYIDDTGAVATSAQILATILYMIEHGWEYGCELVMAKHFILLGKESREQMVVAGEGAGEAGEQGESGEQGEAPLTDIEIQCALSADNRRTAYLALGMKPERVKIHPDDAILIAPRPANGNEPAERADEDTAARYLRLCQEYGDIYGGIPVGHDEYIKCFIEQRIADLEEQFKQLDMYMNDPQQQQLFLSMVFPGKLTHLFRGLPPYHTRPLAEAYERLQRVAIRVLADASGISDASYVVAKQGLGSGGAGLRDVRLMLEPAYVAGYMAGLSFAIAAVPDLVERLRQADTDGESTGIDSADAFLEAVWMLEQEQPEFTLEYLLDLDESKLKKLQKVLTSHRKKKAREDNEAILRLDKAMFAHYEGGNSREAGAWLTAVPSWKALAMSPVIWQQAFRNRCLIPHPNIDPAKLPCSICPAQATPGKGQGKMDIHGHHAVKCKDQNHLTICTHNMVVGILAEVFKSCGAHTLVEPKNVLRVGDIEDGGQPDIVVREHGRGPVAYDVRITSNVAKAQEDGTKATTKGLQIKLSEDAKRKSYQQRCHDSGLGFQPLVATSQGNFSPLLSRTIAQCIANYSRRTHTPTAIAQQYWEKRLSVGLQSEVARAQLTRIQLVALKQHRNSDGDGAFDMDDFIDWDGHTNTSTAPLGDGMCRSGTGRGGGMAGGAGGAV